MNTDIFVKSASIIGTAANVLAHVSEEDDEKYIIDMDEKKELIDNENPIIEEINLPLTFNYTKLKDLNEEIKMYISAHKDCRKLNMSYDKLLKISTLLLTCATSYLLGTESDYYKLETYFAFSSAVTSGLNNYFDNATNGEQHTRLIIMYTELFNKIKKIIDNLNEQKEIDEKYNKYYDSFNQINIKTAEIGLFEHIRKKYDFS